MLKLENFVNQANEIGIMIKIMGDIERFLNMSVTKIRLPHLVGNMKNGLERSNLEVKQEASIYKQIETRLILC